MIYADRPIHAVFSKGVTGATDNDMILPANQIHKFPVDGHSAYFKEAFGATTVHVELSKTVF